jgi:hypothetical protein
MRALLAALLFVAAPVAAQISGTATLAFEGFEEPGGAPNTRLTLNLQCGLTCPTTAPDRAFSVNGGIDAYFAGAPTERTGYIRSDFGFAPSGQNSYVSQQFSAGTAFFFRAKSANCYCGNRAVESDFKDFESNVLAIPPRIIPTSARVGDAISSVLVAAKPRGTEQLEVKLEGAGLSETRTLGPADFESDAALVRFTPKEPGPLTITATFKPHGVTGTATMTVTGNAGGSTGGTGGGDGEAEPGSSSCSATGLGPALLALAWVLRRARR